MHKLHINLLIIYTPCVMMLKKREDIVTKTTDTNKSWEFARLAFSSMERHCLKPSANAFAVWLAYHAKDYPVLCEDIDAALMQGKTIDDYLCDSLFEIHIESGIISDRLINAGGSFESKMHGVLKDIENVRDDAKSFKVKLTSAKEELVKNPEIENVKSVVGNLSDATDQMVVSSSTLEKRIAQSRDEIAALKLELEEARMEASKDALTGVANRKTFNNFIKDNAYRCDKNNNPLSIIMADIDFFKKINDRWGHQTGDQVICYVAGVLSREAPIGGLVARLGGEEFAIVAPNIDGEKARDIAERIRKQVEKKKLIRRNSKEDLGQITISNGVAQLEANEAVADLIERADQALYNSKNEGRNRTTMANQPISKAA